jgi:hypothetical protein
LFRQTKVVGAKASKTIEDLTAVARAIRASGPWLYDAPYQVSTHLNVTEDGWLGGRPQRCQGNLGDGFRDVQWEHEERFHGPLAILLNPYEPNRLKELEGVLRNANTLLQCAHPKQCEELKPKTTHH